MGTVSTHIRVPAPVRDAVRRLARPTRTYWGGVGRRETLAEVIARLAKAADPAQHIKAEPHKAAVLQPRTIGGGRLTGRRSRRRKKGG